MKFFLLIDGMKGDSTEQNHVGWFEIEGFDLDVSNPTDASGGGSGAGKAVFSPLSIEMPADGVLAALLAKVATGGHITSIKLQGVAEAGERQDVVYDLTLADVVVQQVQDSNGVGDDRLLFDYGRIGLVTKAQNPQTGALTPSGSFGYDLTQNVVIDPSTLPVPVPGTVLPAATASKFFLLIDGVKGDSTEQNHVGWFEIEGFDLDVSNPTDASGGGSGAGKAVFSPLSIEMPADGVLAALLAKVATGGHITSIKLQGVAEAGERQDVVYDLTLADVVVQQVQDSNGVGDDRLLFDYGRIGLVTKAQNPQTGALTPSGSFGYDLTQNVVIDPSTLPVPVPGTVLPAATASKFFLLIDGVKGDSTEQNHVGWFEIEGFDLDVSNPTDASGGGSGAGKAVFSPLSIEMPADGALAALLAKVATGGHITSIKLQGVAEAGERQDVVYDLTLADVVVQQVQDSNGGGDDRLVFDYGRIGLVTKAQNPQTGALTPSGSFGYDLTQNVVIDPATLPVPVPGTVLPAATASKFFLLIDGVKGDSTEQNHVGWFEIEGFDLDVSNPTDASGGGSGAGKAVFSPLSIEMPADGVLAALLAKVATGGHITSIKLQGVAEAGERQDVVYDLTLADVVVQQVQDSNGGGDDRLVFDYGRIGLVTKAQNPQTGALTPSGSFGYDLTQNVVIDPSTLPVPTAEDLDANIDGPYGTLEDAPLVVSAAHGVLANDIPSSEVPDTLPAATASKFFLLIDGVKGDSTEQNHVGWFEIEGFDLDVSNLTDASGGGSGAGKAVFSPLSIEMPADGVLAALLAKVATGGHITSIKLQGVAEAGERQDVVYDLTLADVVVQQVQDSNGGGDDRLLFDYGRIGLVTKAQNPQTGALTPSGSFGYDLTQNVVIDPSTLPVPVPGTVLPAATASKFFLLIDGVKGDSTEQNHVGWFEIEGFDLDVSNLTDASGGGSGAGKAVFSPLSIEMPADGVLAALLAKVATGGHITSIKLQGVAEAGERQDVVYDLTLADVVVQQVQDSNGVGDDRLLFDYGRIGLVTKAQNPQTGALTPSGSFGYDLTQNVVIDPSTLPVPVPGTVLPAATASKFFLLIDGVKGDSTEQNHVGWFEIEGFDLDVSNLTDASGGGSGAGKAVFSPLSIEMPADGVLAALLAKVATGGHITSIKLQGVAEAGERQDVVYDLTLADVVVQQVQDSNGVGDDRLLFDYGRIGLVTKAQNPQTGALTPSGSFGYDLTQNVVIDPSTLPVPVPGTVLPAATASKFFLLIDGVKGDSTEQNHVGWFEIEGFDLDVSNLTDASGGGSGAGKAVFSPLSIEMPADGVLAALLAKVATGGHITSIKLQGVAEAGERQDVVYDLTLADVVVQQVQDSNGVGDDRLLFDYGRIGLVTKAQNPQTGALTPSGSFGYDLTQNVAIDPSTLPVPVPGTVLPAATASKFFLLIDGVKGDSTEQNHVGWFEIEGFDLDVSNPTDASGGGSGAGKAVFSPLSIEMPADGVLAALLAKVATGGHITSIKLQGVAEAGERQDVVYDLTLADVVVQQVQDSNGVGDDRLLFDYGRIGLVTKAQNPQTGALTPSGSFGYDLTQNVVIDPSTLPVPVPGTTLPAATAAKFFLLIDGVKGDSTEQNHVGWFEIEGFDLDVSNLTDASGGGSGAGKAVFSPLSIEMPADGVLAALLAKVATGGHITSIKLQGVAEAGERQDVVYDLTLADVVVQQVQDSNGGGDDRLLFDYGRIGLVTKAQNPQTGALTPSGRFGYDLTQNVVIDPATLPVPTTDIPLEAELVSTTAHGQLTLNADGSFVYVPDPNFSGEDFFVYRARQGDTLSEEITVRLVVAPVNDAPVLGDMTVDAQENADNPIIISTDVVDPDAGQTHSFVFDTAATIGQVTDNGDGTFGYTPNGKFEALAAGATAVDSFNITVTDDGGLSSTATVTIRVHGENDAPIAGNVSGQTSENTGNPSQLTALFTDVDIGDTHTFQIETSGTKGTVSNNADGTFSYDPNGAFEWLGAGETALDSFVFKVIDNSGAVSTATATIVIQGENDTPLPTADVAVVRPGSAISVAVSNGVLSNDHDPDANDQLSVSGVSFGNTTVAVSAGGSAEVKGAYGTLTIRSDGSFAYAANNSVSSQGLAQDTFEYMTSDGHGGTAQATLTVAVTKEGYVLGAPGDTLTGGTGKQILDGSLGQQQLLGGNGKDILVGGPEDVLTGGNGPDTFVFREGFGHVTITDFKTRNDVIQWDKNIFANVASIFDHIASDGHGGTIISVDEENSVSLLGVNPASLHKGDFLIM